ncbi:MAG TPA: tetratricopeptide repeat protein [Xanthobacteraceae bacterium]|jgi:tetratricopeptide (TPR) repeat protein/SAM-dependent methyltransferase
MNRKERRAAKKQGRAADMLPLGPHGASPATQMFAAAFRQFSAGQTREAERLCLDVLSFDPRHFDSLHLLGIMALRAGRHAQANELLERALAADARSPECRFNLAQALRACGRLDDAAAHLRQAIMLRGDYAKAQASLGDVLADQGRNGEARESFERALVIDPALVEGHYGLGSVSLREGRFEDAAARYRRVLAARPEYAEAHSNLGVALVAVGRVGEAATHYGRALALNPQLIDVHRNLGRILLAQGDVAKAFALAHHALTLHQTDESRAFFLQCATRLPLPPEEGAVRDDLARLTTRALLEGWTRPSELAGLAAMLIRSGPANACIERAAAAWPRPLRRDELGSADELAALWGDVLLCALLQTAPVQDIAIERFLTNARALLLGIALAAGADATDAQAEHGFYCALAQQCFLNEYVFAVAAQELEQAAQLKQRVEGALASGAAVPVVCLTALAAYAPLHTLADAALLTGRKWPDPAVRIIHQQVNEPAEEGRLRAQLPSLTPISDVISVVVRRHYEEAPYPRWLKPAPVGRRVALSWYLRNQFPHAPITGKDERATLEVLIAGSGTGQHAIETSQRFVGAKVLAIDLSLASLAYAARKASELGIGNMELAQADILELGSIGRSFDLIEASGVLHHMRHPGQGLRVLNSLLRPGGFMHLAFYSQTARADVRAARALIEERRWRPIPEHIRQCREEILSLPDDHPAKSVSGYSDFSAMSECRDLLFHVQEHQFTIPQLKSLLAESGLTFVGFAGPPALSYQGRFPGGAMGDLDQWHQLELEHPKTFVNMYELWVQKPG